MDTLWDVVIVGSSFAGLSAALTFGRARHKVMIIGSGPVRNAQAHISNGVLTHDGDHPSDILTKAINELSKYEATVSQKSDLVTKLSISTVNEGISTFKILTSDGTELEAKKVILATGVKDALPEIPGLKEAWGKKIHVCPYCDAFEYGVNGDLGVFATDPMATHLMNMLAQQWTSKVTLFAPNEYLNPSSGPAPQLLPQIKVLPEARAVSWSGDYSEQVKVFGADDGLLASVDGIFCPTFWTPQSQLALDVGAETHPKGFIFVNADYESSVPGLFAVGDVAWQRGAKMPVNRVAEAIGSGSKAAAIISGNMISEACAAAIAKANSGPK